MAGTIGDVPSSDESMLHLINLPDIVLEKILSYLSFDEVAHLRVVCHRMNNICQQILSKGFLAVEKYHAQCLKAVRSQLPRRESERRNHPLARHCDVLSAVETRLSLLNMTYMKYVDVNLCCFIPGKVIDEIYRILHFVKETKTPPRAHETLQELRDISSMAMEHFDEKIVPSLKQNLISTPSKLNVGAHSPFSCVVPGMFSSSGGLSGDVARKSAEANFKQAVEASLTKEKQEKLLMKKEIRQLTSKVNRQGKELISYKTELENVRQSAAKQVNRGTHLKRKVTEITRRLLEYDQKFADLTEELSRTRGEGSKGTGGAKGKTATTSAATSTATSAASEVELKPTKMASDRCLRKRKPVENAENLAVHIEKPSRKKPRRT